MTLRVQNSFQLILLHNYFHTHTSNKFTAAWNVKLSLCTFRGRMRSGWIVPLILETGVRWKRLVSFTSLSFYSTTTANGRGLKAVWRPWSTDESLSCAGHRTTIPRLPILCPATTITLYCSTSAPRVDNPVNVMKLRANDRNAHGLDLTRSRLGSKGYEQWRNETKHSASSKFINRERKRTESDDGNRLA